MYSRRVSHFKCDGCRLRLHQPRDSPQLQSLMCPSCGSPLDPAPDLSEIVGYRAIDERRTPPLDREKPLR
jgi:hypothetical protein